ncbi:VacJ family lipoprotein [Roseomonas sp. NAR14]|uniref:VacJ family lipoprotein n=1 Tax=Roseomonas acroporae TaxID=2937791 RepID=A0A9X1Y851_9PROT|nr:VacJ family lipoprotein [Roseomonas acroporae]MCK8783980.1 VacJ family lipoprotein [Roseomonas acroporae]
MLRNYRFMLLAALLALPACATPPPADDPDAVAEFRQNNDPWEPANRAMFAVHNAIDRAVLRPVAIGYRDVVPQPVRTGLRNFLRNLRTPVVLVNDMLQGNPRRAGDTLGRFFVNTTVGLGGLIDVANNRLNVPPHSEDWGQTLAVWGVGDGPYMFIPILGPSNVRDTAGFGMDLAIDPLFWFGQGVAVEVLRYSRGAVTAIDTRESLIETVDAVNQTSLDPYATFRSAYRQRRQAEISNRSGGGGGPLGRFEPMPGVTPGTAPNATPVTTQGGAGGVPGVSSSPTGAP